MTGFQPGEVVQAEYKTGVYVAEVVEFNPPRAVVQIMSVLRHPQQGDLHHPMNPEVPFFHQRRALAFREKALVPVGALKPFRGEAASYPVSLRSALQEEISRLDTARQWTERALELLRELESDYFPGGGAR